jgi:hypothetical protein
MDYQFTAAVACSAIRPQINKYIPAPLFVDYQLLEKASFFF